MNKSDYIEQSDYIKQNIACYAEETKNCILDQHSGNLICTFCNSIIKTCWHDKRLREGDYWWPRLYCPKCEPTLDDDFFYRKDE